MAPAKREASSLTNVDGSPPLQACTNARKWLQEHYPDPVIIAIQYYADAQQRRSVGKLSTCEPLVTQRWHIAFRNCEPQR